MAKSKKRTPRSATPPKTEVYRHPEATSPLRPEVGTQSQFKKKKPPKTYRYDSSLAPELNWDGQNPAREEGEALLSRIADLGLRIGKCSDDNERRKLQTELVEATDRLKRLSKPFLNWAGKAERLSFDVPTLPLFVHERLSTKGIIETLQGHKRDQQIELELFGDTKFSITDQVLKAYEYQDKWVNRMVLGDSLVVMNSLLHYEGLGGQVQMIYIDPPYGVKFGSNFQPFVRKRDVSHNDDEDMTREPEMVKAYRDTWELGLHSYLTYMRDRLLLARDLLSPTGSVFVQISDENVHHVREVMDEVFGVENFVSIVTFQKTESQTSTTLSAVSDYLLWYARDNSRLRYRNLFLWKEIGGQGATGYTYIESPAGSTFRSLTSEELLQPSLIPDGWKLFDGTPLVSQSGGDNARFPVEFKGKSYTPGSNYWKTNRDGFEKLMAANRIVALGSRIEYKRYFNDFPVFPLANLWTGLGERGFVGEKLYVVQTAAKVIQRCVLMTTDPGDLVLDPTCVRKGTRVWCSPSLTPSPNSGRDGVGLEVGERGIMLKAIEELGEGEYSIGHDGKPHQVTRVIRKPYRGEMVHLRTNDQTPSTENTPSPTSGKDGMGLWLTADHRVLAKLRPRSLGGNRDWSGVPSHHFSYAQQMRLEPTYGEKVLWNALRNKQLGIKFRRQHPIGPFIADFFSREAQLVVEVDGATHHDADAREYDHQRDAHLRSLGLDVLRFSDEEVSSNPNGICIAIENQVHFRTESVDGAEWIQAGMLQPGDIVFAWSPSPSLPEVGESVLKAGSGRDGVGALTAVRIESVETEWSEEEVYDLEVEGAHSFITETCVVHNCGSGTTAYVAEQWGRRWITIDTSRVPLALARQRLLTATFAYYKLKDEQRGPVGGFVYERKQNNKGEEVGGIVPHVTLKSIANNEPPAEEVLVDRPEEINKITRVSGPFCFEATIPTPVDWDASTPSPEEGAIAQHDGEDYGNFVERMLEVLRKSPVLHLVGGKTIQFKNVRPPAKSLSLSAEAVVEATAPGQKPSLKDAIAEADEKNKGMLPLSQRHVALVFGPENGAVSEKLVYEAAKEAAAKSYVHLYVIGFAVQPNARQLVDNCEQVMGIAATYVQATPDLMMGDLLKNMRSSQIFSVCGLPEIKIKKQKSKVKEEADKYQVELVGLDVFDPITMEVEHRKGDDVPAWLLDTNYNDRVFHVSQAFFPRTGAWDNLKKALKATYEEAVWDHLAGTTSAPFEPGEHGQIAVKVIDDRGNELLVVKKLSEVER
jgi:very-short-patch-repair endonuclease/DNA modification methylase